ncbi:hypothetical protein GCM10023185_06570 [Hymenobacter saemangeumensis]|uniref:Gliding motility-associated C-terminal domain-containing protein n=1 Tax=Hymenobacter saemangeumensis TaxID=1084522 RepID=A0ABP8I210_9BACT
MKYSIVLVWLLYLLTQPALAQTDCPPSAPQPGCTVGFRAIVAGSNPAQEVTSLCVGQRVQFVPCNAPMPFTASYHAAPGTVQAIPGCNPTNLPSNEYTPSAAGPVTIFVVINNNSGGGPPSLLYRITYNVNPTPTPDFDLEPCSGNNVRVTLKPGTSYDQYFIQVGSGPRQGPYPGNAPFPFQPTNGATSVTVSGNYTGNPTCGASQTKTFTALGAAPTPRLVRLTQGAQPGSAATLAFGNVLAPYRYTVLNDNGSGFQPVATITPPASSLTLPGPAAGCYQLRRTDACELDPATSASLCAVGLTATAAAGRNNLAFSYAGAAASIRVERNGTLLTTLPGTARSYEDASNIICGQRYTYRATAVLAGAEESISNEAAVTAVLGPAPPQPSLVAGFTFQNTVELRPLLPGGTIPTGSTLRYRKTTGSGSGADIANVMTARVVGDSTSFDVLKAAPPCYTLRFVDVCGNSSAESAPSCPAFLTARAADADGNLINFSWTPFTGPGTGFTYTLQRLDADGTVLSSFPATTTDPLPPSDRQVLRYRLQISGGTLPAGTFSYSNVASVARQVALTVPSAFTPNGDGLNDVLEIKGRFLKNYSFVVVDRNGQEVFRGTQRSDTWDGSINGRAPVNGAYVWRFFLNDETGTAVTRTGSVTILK